MNHYKIIIENNNNSNNNNNLTGLNITVPVTRYYCMGRTIFIDIVLAAWDGGEEAQLWIRRERW